MLKRSIALLLAGGSLLVACKNAGQGQLFAPISGDVPTIVVNIQDAEKQIPVSDILDSVVYVPLESTRESLFDRIGSMEVYKQYIFILDQDGHSVIVFLEDGRFYGRIDAPIDEVTGSKFRSFTIDKSNNYIVIYDSYSAKFLYYTFDGEKIKEEPIPIGFATFAIIGESTIFYSGYSPFSNESIGKIASVKQDANLLFVKKNDVQNEYRFFNLSCVNNINTYSQKKEFFTVDQKSVLFSHTYSNKVYRLSDSKIEQVFDFKYDPKLSYPVDFLENDRYGDRIAYTNKAALKEKIWSITDIFLIDSSKIIANLKDMEHVNNIYLYDFRTRKSLRFDNIYSDQRSCFLPLTISALIASSGNVVFGVLPAKSIFQYEKDEFIMEKLKKENRLKKFLETGNNLSNPVLTKLYFKSRIQ